MKHKITLLAATLFLFLFVFASCEKNNEEDLKPPINGDDCNTENVKFGQQIWPVINSSCVGCHSGAGASAGIRMGNHAELVEAINGGRFVGAIKHRPGFSAMPQGASKLDDCTIKQIEAWIADGMPNN